MTMKKGIKDGQEYIINQNNIIKNGFYFINLHYKIKFIVLYKGFQFYINISIIIGTFYLYFHPQYIKKINGKNEKFSLLKSF